MSVPVDHKQRLAALNPLQSVCVTAPAGSGKTELLSQRVLTLLARAEQPEEILAITFTRKAAAEMHHRIISALDYANHNAEPKEAHKRLTWQLAKAVLERDKECSWQLLANTGRLKIQTIDSLCGSLTRQMPILSDFGAQPKIIDNAVPHYQAAVSKLFEQLESDSVVADSLEILLRQLDNDWLKVERLLISLLQRRDQWLFHIYVGHQHDDPRSVLESTLENIISDCLADLKHELMTLTGDLIPLFDYAGSNLVAVHSDSPISLLSGLTHWPTISAKGLAQWGAIGDVLTTAKGGFRKRLDKKTGFPTETLDGDKALAKAQKEALLNLIELLKQNPKLESLLCDLRTLPSAQYQASQWVFLQALTQLLPVLVALLKLEFQQYGEVDYSQVSIAALQALGDGLNPSELRLKLDYQLKHILVDEFQDTASTQFELLKRLVEGWHEYNVQNPENPNTLFVVGDGMQSIYGFREANVGLFLEVRKQGINQLKLLDLPLTVNFRSCPAIVDWVNDNFDKAFPAVENLSRGAVKYSPSNAFKSELQRSSVRAMGFIGDDTRLREAEKITALVKQAQSENPEASIAILVRNRSHLNEILPALTAQNIDWQATDIDPLAKNSAVMDLLVLTKALLNIADRISWAALLRTPMVGLNASDLFSLLGDERREHTVLSSLRDAGCIKSLSRFGQERVGKIISLVDAIFSQRGRQTLRSWLEGAWLSLGGAACVSSFGEFKAVDDYFNLVERHQETSGFLSLSRFQEAVDKLYAAPEVNESRLQVMTIHKSKGLEFDTVIIPGLGRRPRANDKSLLMWGEYLSDDGSSGLVMSPLASAGNDDAIYEYLRYEASESDRLENTRLLYVASTRAIESLYLSFCQNDVYDEQDVKKPAKQTLLSTVWSSIGSQIEWFSQRSVNEDQMSMFADDASDVELPKRLSAEWQEPQWVFSNPLSHFYLDTVAIDDADNLPDFQSDNYPRQLGNVVHRLLELCVKHGNDSWLAVSESDKVLWLNRLLEHELMPESRWGEAQLFIDKAINNTLADEKGQWLLSSEHRRSEAEFTLLACLPSGVERKVIDRCFIDENNVRWIIDYKTSTPDDGQSLADFVQQEITHYKGQLQSYQSFMLQLNTDMDSPLTVRTALYFPAIPHWEEVEL